MNENLEDILYANINFNSAPSKSWRRIFCEVCGDGKRTKGPRGGWLIDGDIASYHCFNCGIKGSLAPPYTMSNDVVKILEAFHVPVNKVKLLGMNKSATPVVKVARAYESIPIPDHFIELTKATNHPMYNIACNFLINEKMINIFKYKFFLSTGESSSVVEQAKAKFLYSRLIIPAFKSDEMIYYQSRALINNSKKYMSVDKPRGSSMYFMDRLYDKQISRIFVVEGFFDAYHVNGVAVMENYLTKEQIELLNKCDKPKIVVPDRNGDSSKLINIALQNDWAISIPNFDDDIKDITECVIRYGRLHTAQLIASSIYSGDTAKIIIKLKKL
jgi:hypothetical protein